MSKSNIENNNIISIIIYLISCVLNNIKPDDEILKDINFDNLYDIARKHSIISIVYMAIKNTNAYNNDNKIKLKWEESRNKILRKEILFDNECNEIIRELKNKNIWYMLLKGSIIKKYYPDPSTREMGDIDILYDEKYRKEVRDIFRSKNYKIESYGKGNHDVYVKKPFYNFEMHKKLFMKNMYPRFYDMFDNNSDLLISNDGEDKYERYFKSEDLYIYLVAHSNKHYTYMGTGIRNLIDIYVVIEKFDKNFDWEYIKNKLKLLMIDEYELYCRNLAIKLFKKPVPINMTDLSKNEKEILTNIFSSGLYGTNENKVANTIKNYVDKGEKINNNIKIKYLWDRIFPDKEWWENNSDLYCKCHLLLPILWVKRLFRGIFFRRKNINTEFKAVMNYKT